MALIIHIIIALTSIAVSTMLYFKPSSKMLHVSYGLIGATLATGTYLIFATNASIIHTCISGLVYVSVVATITVLARQKMIQSPVYISDKK